MVNFKLIFYSVSIFRFYCLYVRLFRAKQNFKTSLEMLAFLRLVLKFYLADTPHYLIIISMNEINLITLFNESLLSPPKLSSTMHPEDFLGQIFTTEEPEGAAISNGLYSGGSLTVRNSWSFDIKELPCFLLLYTVSGCGKLLLNQHAISLTEGSMLLLNCRQRFRIDVALSPWKYQVLFFDHALVSEWMGMITEEAFCVLNASPHSDCVLLMERLLCLISDKTVVGRLRSNDLLNHLLTEYTIEFLKKEEHSKIPPYIEQIHEMFLEHYEENYSLDDLEVKYNISKYRICREFGEYYGMSPLQFLNRRRIRMACHLLETTSYRVHEIGSMVGIDNTNHFISLFKKYEGCTPLEFKRK